MDPLELFAQVFGSRAPLGILPEKDWSEWKAQAAAAAAKTTTSTSSNIITSSALTAAAASSTTVTRSAAWTGSSETLPDGTVVFTTRRTLNDRVMTRTETVRTDQKSGRKHSYVSVTSETVVNPHPYEQAEADAAAQEASAGGLMHACHEPISDCHALEYCMFFYRGGTDTATLDKTTTTDTLDKTTTSTATDTLDKRTNQYHSHAIVETNSSAVWVDGIMSGETDHAPEADGCHALGDACLVWNSAASDDDNRDDDDVDNMQDDYVQHQQQQQQHEQESSILGGGCHLYGGCHLWEGFMYLDPEYTGTTNNSKGAVTTPQNVNVSRGAAESLLDPQSWGLCGQWFPE
jgi:hypothetical protein